VDEMWTVFPQSTKSALTPKALTSYAQALKATENGLCGPVGKTDAECSETSASRMVA